MSVEADNWVVLPDRADAGRVVTGCSWLSQQVLAHPSGRPWLVGDLDRDQVTVATVGSVRVAVIGRCPVTVARLTDLVGRVRAVGELDALARVLPGCFHLVASVDGVVRVQGSLTGVRGVFHAQIGRVVVAGDRADVLARIAGSDVDEQMLAVRVACGAQLPPPLGERSFWRGVRALAPDHYLSVDRGGVVSEVRWWQAPEPEEPFGVGAGMVRDALGMAVTQRRLARGRLSADLSGGIDSTSLCFLAAAEGTPVSWSFRAAEADAANDDAVFAAHAAAGLPRAEHLVLAQAEMPDIFADPGAAGDTEAPFRFTRTLARTRHTAELLTARGAREHLAGHGGDELFAGPPAYLPGLLRRRPLIAISHARGYRALYGWPLVATVSAMAGRGGLGGWWRQQARELTTGPPPRRAPLPGWGDALRAPAWITPAAADSARVVLRATADHARPLAGNRGQHVNLAILRMMGPHYRQLSRLYAGCGLRLQLPYLDDRVIEAALAVRQHERSTPWRFKPLLIEAMRGILPEQIAARTTKGLFGEDVRAGLRRQLPAILDQFADSALATAGMITPDLLRRELLTPQRDNAAVIALEDLLACESWLRAAQAPTPPRSASAATAAR